MRRVDVLLCLCRSAHKVSGLMLANHTSIAHLFDRMLKQFTRLYDRKAFLDNYKRQAVFSDGLEEFEASRDIVRLLTDEYRAAETPDYIHWAAGAELDEEEGPSATAAYEGSSASASAAAVAAGRVEDDGLGDDAAFDEAEVEADDGFGDGMGDATFE
jgi:hypothetical protein